MLIVKVYVNDRLIGFETATRVKGGINTDDVNTYLLGSNKHKIKHRYGDGASKLAELMMRNLQKIGI